MSSRSMRRRRAGFTLLEVLLVLAILVVLGSFAVFQLSSVMSNTDERQARAQIGLFKSPIQLYFLDFKQYPPTLDALVEQPSELQGSTKWHQYMEDLPADPWNRPYQYAAPGKHNPSTYDVWSMGPDGVDGSEDDIGNWTTQ